MSERLAVDESRVAIEYQEGATYLDLAYKWRISTTKIARILKDFNITPRPRKIIIHPWNVKVTKEKMGKRHYCDEMKKECVFETEEGACEACKMQYANRYDTSARACKTSGYDIEVVGVGR